MMVIYFKRAKYLFYYLKQNPSVTAILSLSVIGAWLADELLKGGYLNEPSPKTYYLFSYIIFLIAIFLISPIIRSKSSKAVENNELKKFYQHDLKTNLTKLDQFRAKILKRLIRYCLIAFLPISVLVFLIVHYLDDPWYLMALGFITFGIIYYLLHEELIQYRKQFKHQIIKNLLEFIDINLTYNANKKVSKQQFVESGIYQKTVGRYRGDDYVSGKIGATEIEFSEINAETVTYNSTEGGGRSSSYGHIFKGLFFSVDFNKNFKTKTYVLNDIAEKKFGFIGKKVQKKGTARGEIVRLENPEFEKEFIVYAADQIEARYILSPSLLEQLLKFRLQTKKNAQFSFVANRLYVCIPYYEDLFEPSLLGNIVNFDDIQRYHNDLSLITDLVKTLNLNTRIWTKE